MNMVARGWNLFSLFEYIVKIKKSTYTKALAQFENNSPKNDPWMTIFDDYSNYSDFLKNMAIRGQG